MLGSIQSSYSHGDARQVLFETGMLASQADGAVVVTSSDTQLLVTVVASKDVRAGIDFFPLTVDVEERRYAIGKIPGSVMRREGRPGEKAILTARLIDRPLRPSFDDGFRNEVQVIVTILSADQEAQPDVMAINGASAALMISGIPFRGPIGAVRLARVGDQWVPNPTFQELDEATFDLVVAGRRNDETGAVDIVMVEAGATDNVFALIENGAPDVTEDVVAQGLEDAKGFIAVSCDAQLELRAQVNPEPRVFPVFAEYSPEVGAQVEEAIGGRLDEVIRIAQKGNRAEAEKALRDDVIARLAGPEPDEGHVSQIKAAFRGQVKTVMRRLILDEGVRMDGRGPGELRPLSARVGLVKRTHGSALFQRGETQVLSIATLGMLRMAQMLDIYDPLGIEEDRRYMHDYVFAPFSTGETGRVGAPRRREIGHGALAWRAIFPAVPNAEELPYAIRVVSEVLASNGSTSMASVCASSLALMDAGIQLRAPVGGIAMGLVGEGGRFVTLTDILGAEDAFGDMDFKVAGTRTTVTALQLDTKLAGLPAEVLAQALQQAREARMAILDVMEDTLAAPRAEMSVYAPKIIAIKIPIDKIGEVIGPKGKVINEIQSETGANVDVEDDGTIRIGGTDAAAVEKARIWIEQIANPPRAEIGARYHGKVVNITKFGAFVNILPGRDGLLHISKIGGGRRIDRVEDVLNLGDEVEVVVEDIDRTDRVSLRVAEGDEDGAAPTIDDEAEFDDDEWEDDDDLEADDEFEDEVEVDEELEEDDDDLEADDEFEDDDVEDDPVAVPARAARSEGRADGDAPRRRRSRRGRGGGDREGGERPRSEPPGRGNEAEPRRPRVSADPGDRDRGRDRDRDRPARTGERGERDRGGRGGERGGRGGRGGRGSGREGGAGREGGDRAPRRSAAEAPRRAPERQRERVSFEDEFERKSGAAPRRRGR